MVGFGTAQQIGPVRYLGRYSATALILDNAFTFPQTVPAGASVIWLTQKGPYDADSVPGSFYLTASPAGLAAALVGLQGAVAAGVKLNVTTVYPGASGLPAGDVARVFGSDDV